MIKNIILWIFLLYGCTAVHSQIAIEADPDSLISEWIDTGEWEAVSLHPDIVLDWMLNMDSSMVGEPDNRAARTQVFTVNIPSGSSVFNWTTDSGTVIAPVSLRYRIRINEPRRWEFRMQADQPAGDTCFVPPGPGVPKHICAGLMIRPGNIFREIIAGDYQVNTGFGVVAGSSPVFSVSLGNPGSLHRPGKGIRLHSGTDEGRFFRGLAATMNAGKSELIVFGSGKDRIQEEAAGFGWKRSGVNADIGISGIRIRNQYPPGITEGWTSVWQPDSGRYSRIGAWGQIRVPVGILFGEMGWSPARGYGWMTGIRLFELHGFSATARYSGCSPGYPVTYTLFQSGTSSVREGQRLIVSFRYAPARALEWLGSVDVDLSQWPGSNSHFNNPSTRVCQQLKYLSGSAWNFTGSVQLDFLQVTQAVPQKLILKLAFDSDPKQSGSIRFRAGFRQQVQGFGGILTKGSTAECSMSLALAEKKVRLIGGFRLFTVDTGTDPLYAYEPDVSYGWSAPVLSGSGTRWFATLQWKTLKSATLELKISRTAYSDLKHLSDGNQGGLSGKVQVSFKMNQ
jgi:hypothetical protein